VLFGETKTEYRKPKVKDLYPKWGRKDKDLYPKWGRKAKYLYPKWGRKDKDLYPKWGRTDLDPRQRPRLKDKDPDPSESLDPKTKTEPEVRTWSQRGRPSREGAEPRVVARREREVIVHRRNVKVSDCKHL